MFGENPAPEDMDNKYWFAYILSTFVINIVGLNLLIAVIGDNYAKVTERLNAIDCKSRLQSILKVEKKIHQTNYDVANDFSRQYLHVIQYFADVESEDQTDIKLKALNEDILEVKKNQDSMMTKMEAIIGKIKEKKERKKM